MAYNSEKWENWEPWLGGNGLGKPLSLSTAESKTDAGTIVKAKTADMPNLNWAIAQTEAITDEISFVMDRLITLDFSGEPSSGAAESWEFIDDTTAEITLRANQKFHDGVDVTAEDVKFSHDYAKEHPSSRAAIVLDAVDSVEVVDELTTRWNLEAPDPAFTHVTLSQAPWVVPKHIWEDVSNPTELQVPGDLEMIGSGPMEISNFQPPDRVEYSVNEDHYLDFSFDKLITSRYGGVGTAVAAVESGEADFVQRINASEYSRLEGSDTVQRETGTTMSIIGIMMRCDSLPTKDVNLRRAIAHSIDTEDLVNVVFQGFGARMGVSIPFPPLNEFWHNPDRRKYQGGVEEAQSVLADAGYTWNEDGQLLQPKNIEDLCDVGCYSDDTIDGWDEYEE